MARDGTRCPSGARSTQPLAGGQVAGSRERRLGSRGRWRIALSLFCVSEENVGMAKRSWAGVWVVLAILIFAGIVGLGRAILLRPVDPTSQKVP